MNARTPTSTVTPPLITPVTVPTMVALSANAFSSEAQSVGRSTRVREAGNSLPDRGLSPKPKLVSVLYGLVRENSERKNALGFVPDVEKD